MDARNKVNFHIFSRKKSCSDLLRVLYHCLEVSNGSRGFGLHEFSEPGHPIECCVENITILQYAQTLKFCSEIFVAIFVTTTRDLCACDNIMKTVYPGYRKSTMAMNEFNTKIQVSWLKITPIVSVIQSPHPLHPDGLFWRTRWGTGLPITLLKFTTAKGSHFVVVFIWNAEELIDKRDQAIITLWTTFLSK